jgi:hypothetical protein
LGFEARVGGLGKTKMAGNDPSEGTYSNIKINSFFRLFCI